MPAPAKKSDEKPVDAATAKLLEAKRQLDEMEDVSAKTLTELQRQRELLHRSRNNLKTTQVELHKSEGLIEKMMRCWRG